MEDAPHAAAGVEIAGIDVESVDRALATTRAVRRRLDLERHVDDQVLLDCIDIAEQAPTGGNQGSRRWVIVRDQATKDRVADIYRRAAGEWMIESHQRLAGTGHPQERVMASAAYLAEHLAEVPVIVVPTIIGVHDGSGRPGLFDSVIQSVWSFCVALRARGLGSAWTTAVFGLQDEFCDALGVPDTMTPIAMLPVGWMKGTDVKPAPRLPAREVTYFDRFSRTFERGPSAPGGVLADGPGALVEVDIHAPTRVVWEFVSDIDVGVGISDEFVGAEWVEPDAIGVGSQFVGRNERADRGAWSVPCFVDRYEPRRSFGWVTSDPDRPGAQWRFELQPIAGATRLRYRVILGPGPSGLTEFIAQHPDRESEVIGRRLDALQGNMQRLIDAIRVRAEERVADAAGVSTGPS